MRVRLKPSKPDRVVDQNSLRKERDYVVLAVEAMLGESYYRIESENEGVPALFKASLFDLVDNTIPSHWIITKEDDDPIQLMPEPWAKQVFWESFFDGDPDARKVYDVPVTSR